MAEVVPFGIVTNILTKLGSSAFLEISSVYGVENDMRKLESTISTVKAVLLDADQRQENSYLVRDWIKKLNYVVYDADDVMDAFSTKALQHELNSTDGRVLNMQQRRIYYLCQYAAAKPHLPQSAEPCKFSLPLRSCNRFLQGA